MRRAPVLFPLRLLAALGWAAMVGCASVGEVPLPAPPVAKEWPQAIVPDGVGAAQVHWSRYFTDPKLQALIRQALVNNRDLRIAAARVQEARAQFGITDADRKPNVSLGASASFSKTPGDLNASGVPVSGEQYNMSLGLVSFEADFWGRLSGQSEAARAQLLATQAAQKTVHIALIADVATAYYALLQLDETTELARKTLSSRELSLQLVAHGRDAGGVPEAELRQYESILESARSAFEALDYQRAVAGNRLRFLVGEEPVNLPPGLTLAQQGSSVALPAGLPGDVLLLRPDVIAAEHRLRAAHANVAAARAAFLPRILLTAGAGVASAGLSNLFQAGSWTFQPAITMPLLDGGRTAAGRDLAEARKEIAVAEYEKTLQLAFREVADLLAGAHAGHRQLRAALAVEGAQKYRLEAAVARMQTGIASQIEVQDAQRDLLSARQTTLQLRRSQLDTAAQLYRALGGGAEELGSQVAQAQ